MLEIVGKSFQARLRIYNLESIESKANALSGTTGKFVPPDQRATLLVENFMISFGIEGRKRRKVIGLLEAPKRPRLSGQSMIRLTDIGYNVGQHLISNAHGSTNSRSIPETYLEHRLGMNVLPLRLYLDENLLDFGKKLGECQQKIDFVRTRHLPGL